MSEHLPSPTVWPFTRKPPPIATTRREAHRRPSATIQMLVGITLSGGLIIATLPNGG